MAAHRAERPPLPARTLGRIAATLVASTLLIGSTVTVAFAGEPPPPTTTAAPSSSSPVPATLPLCGAA